MPQPRQPQLELSAEVRFLGGVGPRRAELFAQLGVRTVADLLEYYPRSHDFLPSLCLMDELLPEQNVAVAGRIDTLRYNARSRPPRLEMYLQDNSGSCRLIWFHGGYLRDKFVPGETIVAWGKVSRYKEILQIVNPGWSRISSIDELLRREQSGQPIYPATAQLPSRQIARIIDQSLEAMLTTVQQRYGNGFCQQRKLPPRCDALRWIHRPPDRQHLAKARRRLVYDELFLMELGLAIRAEHARLRQRAFPLNLDDQLGKRIRRLFPFVLTNAQDKVITEICADLARTRPMNRLLQGDVGSGKTVVALYAALLAVGRHCQVAIMTPTEILAEQHFLSIERYLSHSRVRRVLLTGGMTGRKRSQLLEQIHRGEIDLIVGTQALLQHDVTFDKLALVVIDEQHKFGVRQRERIRQAGPDGLVDDAQPPPAGPGSVPSNATEPKPVPHYLVMTATPIPRTLAMTVFGDLEISTIDRLPPGRRRIITRWIKPEQKAQAYQFIRDKVNQGRQVYIVCPRVQETTAEVDEDIFDGLDLPATKAKPLGYADQLKAAIAEREYLQREVFAEFTVGLLHGQMDHREKQQSMADFRSGKINILVATVVIEVGIDVPNATIMVIEHADHFGLAQLHQLRGRIGRGEAQSYCLLFGQARTEVAQQRLEIMTKTTDGFRIAEEDLRIRGPGQFFGAAQHGLPQLKIADILDDADLLRMARRDAFALARDDPQLKAPENHILRRALLEAFGEDLGLVDVG